MKSEASEHLERATEFLGAAKALLSAEYASVAVGRAYYAMFHAATAALLERDIVRSSHHALIAAFGQFVVKPGDVDERFHAYLRDAFTLRSDSDYLPSPAVSVEEAQSVTQKADEFVAICCQLCKTR